MALVEHTNYMTATDYGGRHLVYLGNYRPMDDPLLRMPARPRWSTRSLPHLARINPAFDPIVGDRCLVLRGALRPADRDGRLPRRTSRRSRRRSPGLWVATMFQVYPHDRGQNYSIDLAERLVRYLDERLTGR